jgi:amidase
MCRTVADAAAVLAVLVGADDRDPVTKGAVAGAYGNLDPAAVRGARIGVARAYFGYQPELDARVEESIAALRSLGAEIIDPVKLGAMKEMEAAELEVLLYEFKTDLEAYLAGLGPSVQARKLADLIAFNEQHAGEEMPFFGQELFIKAQEKGPLTDAVYRKALATCARVARKQGIDAVMSAHKLDALVTPTNSPAWVIDPVLGDHYIGGSSSPAAVAGYPSVTVPAGFVRGLPVGISLFGRRFQEQRLLVLAHALEQATKQRRPPTFTGGPPASDCAGCRNG